MTALHLLTGVIIAFAGTVSVIGISSVFTLSKI
jgi:hypothetical protein